MVTPEKGSEAPSAEQHVNQPRDSSLPSGKKCRTAHSHLAELLQAAASIVVDLHREEPAVEKRARERHGTENPATIFCQQGTSVVQPAHAATILMEERHEEPAKCSQPTQTTCVVLNDVSALCQAVAVYEKALSARINWAKCPLGPECSLLTTWQHLCCGKTNALQSPACLLTRVNRSLVHFIWHRKHWLRPGVLCLPVVLRGLLKVRLWLEQAYHSHAGDVRIFFECSGAGKALCTDVNGTLLFTF
ncbi:unnamed protein product [Lampetra planeri]